MFPAYREYRPSADLDAVVACAWEHEPAEDRVQRVVPDGCVDLIWLAEGELVIAGADTGPRSVGLPAQARSSGIRRRPGSAGRVLGLPGSELTDRQIAASLVLGEQASRLEEALADAAPNRRLELLADAVSRRSAIPDALVIAGVQRLAIPRARVAGVAAELGISERQLHRRMVAAVGYGPKMIARVARLRRVVALSGESLASRAFEAGYASQAHMANEVRRLTGLTRPIRERRDAHHRVAWRYANPR